MQNQIYINQALGKAGTISRLNPCDKIPVVAEGSAVVAGGFVFEGTDPERQVIGCSAATSAKVAADVAGVAVFEAYQMNTGGVAGLNGLEINEGRELAKVRKGYVYVTAATAATHGQVVGIDPATGVIKTANAAGSLPSAAAGKEVFVGANTKLSDLQAISSGTITVNVDGNVATFTGIDLHAAASLSDVATALSSAITGVTVTVTDTNNLTFTSGTSSASSKVSVLDGTVGVILLALTHTETVGNSAYIDTGWKVETGAAAGQPCEIYKI